MKLPSPGELNKVAHTGLCLSVNRSQVVGAQNSAEFFAVRVTWVRLFLSFRQRRPINLKLSSAQGLMCLQKCKINNQMSQADLFKLKNKDLSEKGPTCVSFGLKNAP